MAATSGLHLSQQRSKFYAGLVEELIVFAEHVFRLARKQPDGANEGQHRASASEQWLKLGKAKAAKEALPDAPPYPAELDYLWGWFVEIVAGLSSNGMGAAVITWETLRAWCELMRLQIRPWEARALIKLSDRRAVIDAEVTQVQPDRAGA
ncbi:MAG: hypothetical protein GEU95_26860 [Rhizobiales bacterium]|nr:hypothetical protein [Hyphomicrobiales bacterium]